MLEHECRCNRQINPLIMLKRNQLIRIVCLTLVEGQRKVRLLRPGHRRPGTIILASRSTDRQTDRQINLTLRDHNNCDHWDWKVKSLTHGWPVSRVIKDKSIDFVVYLSHLLVLDIHVPEVKKNFNYQSI